MLRNALINSSSRDTRFISKDLPHPLLAMIQDESILKTLSLTTIRLIYKEALYWRHRCLPILEKFINEEKVTKNFRKFSFFILETKLADLIRRRKIKSAFALVETKKEEMPLPHHLVFEMYFQFMFNSKRDLDIKHLKELFACFLRAYEFNKKYLSKHLFINIFIYMSNTLLICTISIIIKILILHFPYFS